MPLWPHLSASFRAIRYVLVFSIFTVPLVCTPEARSQGAIQGNIYATDSVVDSNGETIALPPIQDKPSIPISGVGSVEKAFSTGPCIRQVSIAGYNQVRGSVYLPCDAAHLQTDPLTGKPLENGFIYVGGWGNGNGGASVDAGFQYSVLHDDYAVIVAYYLDHHEGKPGDARIRCGQTVAFQFGPVPDGTSLNITVHGVTTRTGQNTVTVPFPRRQGDGWDYAVLPGNDVVVKRMVSIGQPNGWSYLLSDPQKAVIFHSNWDRSGSYFGRTATLNTPLIRWTNVDIGKATSKAADVAWTPWVPQIGVPTL